MGNSVQVAVDEFLEETVSAVAQVGGDGDADLPVRRTAAKEKAAGQPFGVVGNGEGADADGPDGELFRVEGADRPRQGGAGQDLA